MTPATAASTPSQKAQPGFIKIIMRDARQGIVSDRTGTIALLQHFDFATLDWQVVNGCHVQCFSRQLSRPEADYLAMILMTGNPTTLLIGHRDGLIARCGREAAA